MIIVGWVLYDKGVFAVIGGEPTQQIESDVYLLCTAFQDYYNITADFSDTSVYNYQIGKYSDTGYSLCYYKPSFTYNSGSGGSYTYVSNSGYNIDFYMFQGTVVDGVFSLVYPHHVTGSTARIGQNMSGLTYYYSSYAFGTTFEKRIYDFQAPIQEPYFVTSETDIQNWDFDFLEINGGDVPYYTAFPGGTLEDQTTYIELNLVYNYVNYEIDVSQFITIDEDTAYWSIKIPKNYLFNFVNVQNGVDFKFSLFVEQQNPFEQWTIETNTMTFNLTDEQLAEINSDTNKQIQGTIVSQQQQIVDGQQQLQNTITDTTVPADSEFDLPTIEVNDSTANFFDTLFTGIYNAFNTSEDTSISFTIFSKTITINSADFRMLNDSRFTILRNLLESSWYFAIGYMILKDIRHIFDKIKTGNIENAVSNDIKADMV